MFTFQVIRLTSVVVYTKWFRSKCKAQAGGSAWPSYLRPHVLPVSPCPACIPMSHFLPFLPWCRQYPTGSTLGFFLVGSFLSLPPLSVTRPSYCQRGDDGWEGNHRPSPLLCGCTWLWQGAGKGLQRPKPADSLFQSPGMSVQSPQIRGSSYCWAMRALGHREPPWRRQCRPTQGFAQFTFSCQKTGRAAGLRSGCTFESTVRDNKNVPGRSAEGQSPT